MALGFDIKGLFKNLKEKSILVKMKKAKIKQMLITAVEKAGYHVTNKTTILEAKEALGIPLNKLKPPKPPADGKHKQSDSQLPPSPKKSDEIREGEIW